MIMSFKLNMLMFIYPIIIGPTSGRAVLPSKLVDGRFRVQSIVPLADIAVRSFRGFLRSSGKKGQVSLVKTPKEGILPAGLGDTWEQLVLILQANLKIMLKKRKQQRWKFPQFWPLLLNHILKIRNKKTNNVIAL